MPRARKGAARTRARNKILTAAKGYVGGRHRLDESAPQKLLEQRDVEEMARHDVALGRDKPLDIPDAVAAHHERPERIEQGGRCRQHRRGDPP